ncbi:hypothetical protein GKZ90_0012305 [Flavobacterium sp. MC2016-06]|uniref:hypothetical protein n=1 Tax=Flavobacterium sp. MC2016-06 TaxID=2676308 RepID=UPI0012BA6963|nr:hypothetical protein [Flavobacterium sp. MC2016-06]MBU3862401.1 hypothetical protein [Flavobacterium sp. MC2016-06]
MKIVLYIFLCLVMVSCKDQKKERVSYLVKAKEIAVNSKIRALIPKESENIVTETIDFDNDSKKDYICTLYDPKKQINVEYWITSDYKILLQNEFLATINDKFFINLDNDNLMELFRSSGEEDGVDCAFYDIKNNKLEPILYFTPILIDDSKPNNYFYGYAWDISDIVMSGNKLLSAINDTIVERDGNFTIPKNQKNLPVIFFKGKTTQPEIKYPKTFKKNYYSLEKIRSSVEVKEDRHAKNKDFKIGQLYNDSDLNIGSIYVNYNSGKYKFDENYHDFLVDSTVTEDESYQSIGNLENENISAKDKNVIRIRDFGVADSNDRGNFSLIFCKKIKDEKWKVIDIVNIGKAIDMSEHQYKMEGNKYLSFSCYNNKGYQYYGLVINKIDSSGKYEKVLKAYKYDFVNEKIVEVDLKKEKVECFPEIGDE